MIRLICVVLLTLAVLAGCAPQAIGQTMAERDTRLESTREQWVECSIRAALLLSYKYRDPKAASVLAELACSKEKEAYVSALHSTFPDGAPIFYAQRAADDTEKDMMESNVVAGREFLEKLKAAGELP